MKTLSAYIHESMSNELSQFMDEVSDYFADMKSASPFNRYGLSRAGYRTDIPYGDKRYAALVWEGDGLDSTDVLMMFDEPKDGEFTGMFLKVTGGDYHYRKFKDCGGHDFSFGPDWKRKIKRCAERFLKEYF